ncbi:CaiB/BaiF CoA-transferase family protein [Haliea sp.]|uniref:CaiB/BaiF CoA transferase family protein n=1 Tax=Haliea TaxID=475794 RepID=UPI000C415089|nr:CaiB/BaiF CoA-transferase family protein [Haliea sp.]HCD54083.1 carnitine dehydratase [Halieaceae bacterium]MAD63465.1 carnitine dehydratase [Haliea sp.]MAY93467.1 carnitine dehydratase [Haliea sp.]MBK41226.1 carnitine dehydratase [Haliea sp.]MBP71783.1 carnitine dehydratase [Haliea sp.]
MTSATRPLEGLRVIELGQLLAGPFACTILAYFGAEVIKVEAPTGDPIRGWRVVQDGTSLWYRSLGRNKKSVTLDLKSERGRALVLQLLDSADVLVENFRPGAMEDWGLGPDVVKARNPRLVYARISGYGQTGPYASKPGYASVTEAFGGFRYINGEPGKAPVRPNISLGDTVAGLHAALGITLALLQRAQPGGEGQVVDVALYESVFNLLEGMIPEYDGAGVVREPAGTTVTGIVPTNTYHCDDGKYVVIGGNGDAIFKRLMTVAGRSDMAADPELADNVGRVRHEAEIDKALGLWCGQHSSTHVINVLEEARVPVGPIYSVADMLADPQYQARGLFEQVEIDGKPLKIPAIMPRLGSTPGRTEWPGGALGSANREVLQGLLGLGDEELAQLAAEGVIAPS